MLCVCVCVERVVAHPHVCLMYLPPINSSIRNTCVMYAIWSLVRFAECTLATCVCCSSVHSSSHFSPFLSVWSFIFVRPLDSTLQHWLCPFSTCTFDSCCPVVLLSCKVRCPCFVLSLLVPGPISLYYFVTALTQHPTPITHHPHPNY